MGGAKRHQIDFFEILSGLYLLLMILLVLVISAAGDHKIFYVLVGFLPVLLVVMISMMIHESYAKHKSGLLLLPIIITAAFYFFGTATPSFASQFDVDLLTGVNFILSVVYVLIVFSVFMKDFEKKTTSKTQVQKPVEKKSLQEYIHSIEDKSKALNFVIGRVYNKFHGGTDELRDKLRIPAEWYNEFSLIGVGTEKIDYGKLYDLITQFELQLKNFEKTEYELFKEKSNNLKNLIRDIKGNDKIIDVIDHNDKDPVRSYYEGAIEFCKKVKEEIENDNLKLIKNTYIPKDEEELAEITGKQSTVQSSQPTKMSDLPPIKKEEKTASGSRPKPKKTSNINFDRRPPNLHP